MEKELSFFIIYIKLIDISKTVPFVLFAKVTPPIGLADISVTLKNFARLTFNTGFTMGPTVYVIPASSTIPVPP